MYSNKSIKIAAIISYVTIGLEILLGLLYTPWMLSIIGADNFYLYNLATSLIAMFAIDFALGSAVTRFIVKFRFEDNVDNKVNNFLGIIYKLYFVIDIVVLCTFIIIGFFLENIYVGLSYQQLQSFKVVYCILVFSTIITFPATPFNGIMSAYENFIALKLIGLIQKIVSVGCIIIILYFRNYFGLTHDGYLIALVASSAFWNVFFVGVKLLIIKFKHRVKANLKWFNKDLVKEIFGFSIWVLLLQLSDRLFVLITPSVFGIVSNSDNGAIYSLAAQLESYGYTFACAINGMFIGKVSRLIKDAKYDDINKLIIKVTKFQHYILGLIICGFLSIGKNFIQLWAGEGLIKLESIPIGEAIDYVYLGALLFFITMCLSKTQNIAESVALIENKVRIPALVFMLTGVVYVPLTLIITRDHGAIGTIATLCIMIIIRTVVINVYYQKSLNIDVLSLYKSCYVPIVIVVGLTYLINLLFFNNADNNLMVLLIRAMVITISYSTVYFMIYLNKSEKSSVIEMLSRLGNRIGS